MGIRNLGETDSRAETGIRKGLLRGKNRAAPTSPRNVTRHHVCEMHSRKTAGASNCRFRDRGKEFSPLEIQECGGTRTFVPRKCCAGTPEEADDAVVPEMTSVHSPANKSATRPAHLTNDFAAPNHVSGSRIMDEAPREGDLLVDAHERKKAAELTFRRTRSGGHVEPPPVTGSPICSLPGRKLRSFIKINGSPAEWSSRLPEPTGFSSCPGRAETASGLQCTKVVRQSKRE